MPRKNEWPAGVYRKSNGAFMWDVQDERLPNGRMVKSLGTKGPEVMYPRVAALNQLMVTGYWGSLERWADGELDVTDLVNVVMTGDFDRLRRISSGVPTVGDAIERYLAKKRETVRPTTYRSVESYMKVLREAMGWVLMDKVTSEDCGGYLLTTGWGRQTQMVAIRRYRELWRKEIGIHAERCRVDRATPLLVVSPWAELTPLAADESDDKLKVMEEGMFWEVLLPAVRGSELAFFIGCSFLAGLRIGETRNLRPGVDVLPNHPDGPTIRVQSRTTPYPWKTKNKKSARDVPMMEPLVELYEEHLRLGLAGVVYCFESPRIQGAPIGEAYATQHARRAFEAAGILYGRGVKGGMTAHSGRHSFATWLAKRGYTSAQIAEVLGNTARIVEAHYLHFFPKDGRPMVERLGGELKAITTKPQPRLRKSA